MRVILNKAFFSKLYVDGRKISGHELEEPFDLLHEVYEIYQEHKRESGTPGSAPSHGATYYRRSGRLGRAEKPGQAQDNVRGTLLTEDAPDRDTLIHLLGQSLAGIGSSRRVMVGDTGIEPVTPTVSR